MATSNGGSMAAQAKSLFEHKKRGGAPRMPILDAALESARGSDPELQRHLSAVELFIIEAQRAADTLAALQAKLEQADRLIVAIGLFYERPLTLDAIVRALDENTQRTLVLARAERARSNAEKRHAETPAAIAKEFAIDCWMKWKQQDPTLYKGPTDFARAMLDERPGLKDIQTIMRWQRQWTKGVALPPFLGIKGFRL